MDEEFADDSVVASKEWKRSEVDGELDSEIDNRLMVGDEENDAGGLAVHSLSGKERNHLFLNEETGKDFTDFSALSGMDSESDSRCFVLFDYDHDGWQDVALVNANQPLMQLFHNDIAKLPGANKRGGMIAIRFVGGNTTSKPSEFASRDGYGAMVEVELTGGVKLKREHRCGEGYAAQNSSTMIIGIGERSEVASVSVRWPSGKVTSTKGIAEGTLLTVYENRAAGDFVQSQYRNSRGRLATGEVEKKRFPISKKNPGKVQVYTTTATWCAACIGHLPALKQLESEEIALYGIPIDASDDPEKLATYVEQKSPPYQMLAEISSEERQGVTKFIAKELGIENPLLPSSVITDSDGNVLEVMPGVPTLSQVRKWSQPNN